MSLNKYLKIIIFFLIIFSNSFAYSNEKIYYIDMDYIVNNSVAGKSIIKQLEEEKKSYLTEFKKIEDSLKVEENKIISQKNILSKDEYDKKVKTFTKNVSDYKVKRNKDNQNISILQAKAQKTLGSTLQKVLAKYSEDNSLTYILHKQSIIIGKTELDITNIILEIFNSEIKQIKIK